MQNEVQSMRDQVAVLRNKIGELEGRYGNEIELVNMRPLVCGDNRVPASDQCRNDSQIGHVAGGEEQGAGKAREVGELLFKCRVRRQVAADQM